MAFPGTDIHIRGARRRTAIRSALALASALAAASAAGLASACAPADAPPDGGITVEDGAGRAVSVPEPARRVVSMMPSVTEWVIAFGAADRLVARTDYDDHPIVADLPTVGGGLTPSVEWLAARGPDLIIAWPDAPSRSLVSRIEALGIPVYTAPSETIGEALDVASDMGRLLGLPDTADAVVGDIRARLDSIREGVASQESPAVLFLIGLDPAMAAGPGTFLDELVTIAGGRNVLEGTSMRWPQLSLEEVVTRAPDVLIVGSAGDPDPAATLRNRPGWREVPAVQQGRVYAVDPDRVNRPGPGLADSAALLARLIHGTP